MEQHDRDVMSVWVGQVLDFETSCVYVLHARIGNYDVAILKTKVEVCTTTLWVQRWAHRHSTWSQMTIAFANIQQWQQIKEEEKNHHCGMTTLINESKVKVWVSEWLSHFHVMGPLINALCYHLWYFILMRWTLTPSTDLSPRRWRVMTHIQ